MGIINSLIQGDGFKIGILFFFIGSLIMVLVVKLRKLLKKHKKKAILYALFLAICTGLAGLLSSSKVLNDTPLSSYIGFQIIFFILGILNIFVLRRHFKDLSNDETDYFSELLFSIAMLCIALTAFFVVVNKLQPAYKYTYLIAAIAFIIPLLVYKLYELATLIPVPVYKQWLYPLNENIKDPTSKELENPLVISFEFKKQENTKDITNFRVKAPEAMEFGKLFYFFINDYNDRHPESIINYTNGNQPEGWIFYFKPNWWSGLQHINFDKTIYGNNIKEDNVIICQRVDYK